MIGGGLGVTDGRFVIRDRLRRGRNPRENINLLLNAQNEVMFFNSPCKFHFAFNQSDFHEGIDLNLMNL